MGALHIIITFASVAAIQPPHTYESSDELFGPYQMTDALREYCSDGPNTLWDTWRLGLVKYAYSDVRMGDQSHESLKSLVDYVAHLDTRNAPSESCTLGTLSMRIVGVLLQTPEAIVTSVLNGELDTMFIVLLHIPWLASMHLGWPIFQLLHRVAEVIWEAFGVHGKPDYSPRAFESAMLGLLDSSKEDAPTAAVSAATSLAGLLHGPGHPSTLTIYPSMYTLLERAQQLIMYAHLEGGGLMPFLLHKDSLVLPTLGRLATILGGMLVEAPGPRKWCGAFKNCPDFALAAALGGINVSILGTSPTQIDRQKVLSEDGRIQTQLDIVLKPVLRFLNEPSNGFAQYFLANCRAEFYGWEQTIENFITRLARMAPRVAHCWPNIDSHCNEPLVLIDIGAANFDGDCFIIDFLNAFGCDAKTQIYGFEPLAQNLEDLRTTLDGVPGKECVQLEKLAATNVSGKTSVYGKGRTASLMYHEVQRHDEDDVPPEETQAVRLDDWIAMKGVPHIDILKIDVEGAEWKVLQGAWSVLREKRTTLVIIEYGHFWSRDFWAASGYGISLQGATPFPSLHGVTQELDSLGYDGYLVGSKHLLPLNGACWHDIYEVCRSPHSTLYRGTYGWCWFDVIFCNRAEPLCQAVRKDFVPWHFLGADASSSNEGICHQ